MRLTNLALALLITLASCADSGPQLRHDDTVPDDLRALADATWQDFLSAIPARVSCVTEPTLRAAWELSARAVYDQSTATLTVRVPGTPATLRSELIHEFAHHLEYTCPEQRDLRAGFLVAQGFPTDADWFAGSSWATTPSEQYAEAMVEMVEGKRSHRGQITLNENAIAVLRNWANSGP